MSFGSVRLLTAFKELRRAVTQTQSHANDAVLRPDVPGRAAAQQDLRVSLVALLNHLAPLLQPVAEAIGYCNLWKATHPRLRLMIGSATTNDDQKVLQQGFELLGNKASTNAEALAVLHRETGDYLAGLDAAFNAFSTTHTAGSPDDSGGLAQHVIDDVTALRGCVETLLQILDVLQRAWSESARTLSEAGASLSEPHARHALSETLDRGLMEWERLHRTLLDLQKVTTPAHKNSKENSDV